MQWASSLESLLRASSMVRTDAIRKKSSMPISACCEISRILLRLLLQLQYEFIPLGQISTSFSSTPCTSSTSQHSRGLLFRLRQGRRGSSHGSSSATNNCRDGLLQHVPSATGITTDAEACRWLCECNQREGSKNVKAQHFIAHRQILIAKIC